MNTNIGSLISQGSEKNESQFLMHSG